MNRIKHGFSHYKNNEIFSVNFIFTKPHSNSKILVYCTYTEQIFFQCNLFTLYRNTQFNRKILKRRRKK